MITGSPYPFFLGYTPRMFDCEVAVIGGGPAGLQCALVLARARRRVLVFDAGEPRNSSVRQTHGLFTRDGEQPYALLQQAREQLLEYGDSLVQKRAIANVHASDGEFDLTAADGSQIRTRRLVLATGMRDDLPDIRGLESCWGTSAFVCPYCDGWEVRDRALAVWGNTRSGTDLAKELYQWSRNLLVCSETSTSISREDARWLQAHDVRVKEAAIARLIVANGMLSAVEFEDGERIPREAMFLDVTLRQASDLPERLGCRLTARGHIDVDTDNRTSVAGVYAIGDAVTHLHQVVFAAASGARAAIAINTELSG